MLDENSDSFDKPEPEPSEEDGTLRHDPIRVLVADSRPIYRVGMRNILTPEPDILVVSEVDSVRGLLSDIESVPSDVVIVDSHLVVAPQDAIPELLRLAPAAKIIVATGEPDETDTVELYRRGVRGVISRSITPDLLVKSVRKVAAGEPWIDNETVDGIIEAFQSQTAVIDGTVIRPRLSPKELMLIACITQGKRNKEIAQQLQTTEQVIKNRLSKVYRKLGVSDRLELALYCVKHDLQKNPFPAEIKGIAGASASQLNGNGKSNGQAMPFVMSPKV